MSIAINVEEKPGYLDIVLIGEWELDELKRTADTVAAESRDRGIQKVLVDATGISGYPPDFDRYQLGEYAAAVLRGVKIAVVYRADYINGFFENTAVNRGARIFMFPEENEAMDWLVAS